MIAPQTQRTRTSRIKRLVKRISILRWLYQRYNAFLNSDYLSRRAKVKNMGYGSYKKMIVGSDNLIIIGNDTCMSDTMFHIVGYNNTIEIGKNCIIGKGCSFWIEWNNIKICIGDDCTFTQYVHMNAQEDSSKIVVGTDCMFSNHIIVRTSDSHPMYSLETNERINQAKDITIGSHVWIAPDSKIMKGAIIGDNSIIGSNTMVTKTIPNNCLAVGMPAIVVKEGIYWTREDVIFKSINANE